MDNEHTYKHKHAPEFTENLLHSIVGCLSSLVCFVAFRSVCKWRSFFLQHHSYLVPPPPPWLMLPNPHSKDSQPTVYGLYGFEYRKLFYKCNIPSNYDLYPGSSGTWLIFIDRKGGKLRVWNPLSLIEVSLPLVKNEKYNPIVYTEIILSRIGPLIKNYQAVLVSAVHNCNNLVVMWLGEEKWTSIEIESFPSRSLATTRIVDLLFYKGKFYLVNQSWMLFVCEENVHTPRNHDHHYCHPIKAIKFIDPVDITRIWEPIVNAKVEMYFLLEVKGDTHCFRIFKFDFTKSAWKFVTNRGLKGCLLFLNHCNGSMPAREVSRRTNIYFEFYDIANEEGHQKDHWNHKVLKSNYSVKKPASDVFL
ncbi:hypothetical protein Sjap_010915 [Stephania japonica]|uniref:KIB1-4 beta-propeller domain-containing protein n=1 Tax=Stephania japonica TaxID=461633 RepID=A0AAP0JCI2_9MAGN